MLILIMLFVAAVTSWTKRPDTAEQDVDMCMERLGWIVAMEDGHKYYSIDAGEADDFEGDLRRCQSKARR